MPLAFGTTDYDAVRAAIRTSLDAENLPNEIIALPIYEGRALAGIAARTTNTTAHALTAATYLCAALLFPAVPQLLTDADDVGGRYTVAKVDIKENVARLLGLMEDELALLPPADMLPPAVTVVTLQPVTFTVAPAGRCESTEGAW